MKICIDCISFQEQKKKLLFTCLNKKSKFFGASFPYKLAWRICPLYKEVVPIRPKGVKFIEDFRGRKEFKDSTFWIIGADPNLDFYQEPYCSDDFFKDKFTITVNLVWRVFPESTFYISGHKREDSQMEGKDCNLKKCILSLRVERLLPSASLLPSTSLLGFSESLKEQDLEPIYIKVEGGSSISSKSDFETMVRRIFSDGPHIFKSPGTSAHLGIFAAAILGARRVVLVGCTHRIQLPEIKMYAHRKGLEKYARGDSRIVGRYERLMRGWEQNLVRLTEALKKYDVEVIRHRYDEEKNKFVFEEIIK